MNRDEFIVKLQDELKSIPFEEKESALKYYREYFDDAGVENEQQVISELESPETIAQGIKKDLGYTDAAADETGKETIHREEKSSASHNGATSQPSNGGYSHTDSSYTRAANTGASTAGSANTGSAATGGTAAGNSANTASSTAGPANGGSSNTSTGSSQNGQAVVNGNVKVGNREFPVWAIILLAILFIPVIIPVASGIFGTGIGLVCGAIGIAIGFFAATVALLVSGIATVVWGIASIIAGAFYTGILLIGLGLVLIGFGLMFLILAVQLVGVWIPRFVRWIIHTVKNGFHYSNVQKGVPA